MKGKRKFWLKGRLKTQCLLTKSKVNQLASGLHDVGSAISLGGGLLQLGFTVGQSNTHLLSTQHNVFPITMNKRAKFWWCWILLTSWEQKYLERSLRNRFCCAWGVTRYLIRFWGEASSGRLGGGVSFSLLACFRLLAFLFFPWTYAWRRSPHLLVFSMKSKKHAQLVICSPWCQQLKLRSWYASYVHDWDFQESELTPTRSLMSDWKRFECFFLFLIILVLFKG